VGTIVERIVYVENRDGNVNVKTGQAETLERAYQLLDDNGIKINRCSRRSDHAKPSVGRLKDV
jgi:hypothetical protein